MSDIVKEKKSKRLSATNLLPRKLEKKRPTSSFSDSSVVSSSGEDEHYSGSGSSSKKSHFSSTVLLDELIKLKTPNSSRKSEPSSTTTPTSTSNNNTSTDFMLKTVKNHDQMNERVEEIEKQVNLLNDIVLKDRDMVRENNELLREIARKSKSSCCQIL